jgi:processive 1,2-diacylglycerol beta-glucosyltransferase
MRVLIPTVTAGAGHLQAAVALEEAWRALRPADTVQRVDVLDYVPRLQKKLYAEGYVKVVERAPELYAHFFRKTDNPALLRKLARVRHSFARQSNRAFVNFLREFAPDVMLCPHFLPLEILGGVRRKTPAFNPLAVCVVTDFEAHAFWIEPAADFYCVAAEHTKARLVARGIAAERVLVTGIPVAAKFSAGINVAAVRAQLGLKAGVPTLLVLSGGFGMGPVAEILAEIEKVPDELQIVVVAGRNEKLRRELASQPRRHPTNVLGFATNMHELMAVADLVITKPGGLTSSEALAMGRPLFILNPIPGQEAANSDFLLEHGAAIKANRSEDVPYRLGQLLGTRKLREMARAAKLLGQPKAARTVCEAALKQFEAR